MAKIYFTFGVHNHQPVGNFQFVFEDAYQHSYLPFLEIVEAHPQIRITMHYSGILLDWFEEEHPDFLQKLARLVETGQIEIMTGAYYEPILMTIPDRDKIGQILKLTSVVKKHTGYDAKGLWLAERVWEPHLPKILKQAGVQYTIIDDSHFKYAGLKEKQLHGYYITEEQGATLNIFPIAEKLRYTIPFQDPEATIHYFRELADQEENPIAIFADDGEKFGVWPGTYDHVFKNRWLEHFFSAIERESECVEMIHFSEAVSNFSPKGRVYLPTASYREMMEWALPFEATRELEDFENILKEQGLFDEYAIYVRGGFWRNFLAKYPESNNMHKKMLYVSQKINNSKKEMPVEAYKEALDHLWASQCNCPYWHGVFGGLYLAHIRYAIYQNLIQAENKIDEYTRPHDVKISIFDLTGNGKEDIIIETPLLNVYIDPSNGGNIFELDYKPGAVNLQDTLTRREEAYHRKLLQVKMSENDNQKEVASIHDLVVSKEKNLHEYLKYDWYLRNALLDHFLEPATTLKHFADCQYNEVGDFVNQPYQYDIKKENNSATIKLHREGGIWDQGNRVSLLVEKKIILVPESSIIQFRYRIRNLSNQFITLHYGTEWNIGLLAGNSHDRYYEIPGVELKEKHLASIGSHAKIQNLSLVDEWQNLRISFHYDQPTAIWRFPIETVSLSEGGFERVYQCSCVLARWKIDINQNEEKELSFWQEIAYIE